MRSNKTQFTSLRLKYLGWVVSFNEKCKAGTRIIQWDRTIYIWHVYLVNAVYAM